MGRKTRDYGITRKRLVEAFFFLVDLGIQPQLDLLMDVMFIIVDEPLKTKIRLRIQSFLSGSRTRMGNF